MASLTKNSDEPVIDALNELLRGEMSAVESYDQALERLHGQVALHADLRSCRALHVERVERLRSLILQHGGRPSDTSGIWGSFVKVLEGTATALGAKAAVTMLEEGEEHGLREYNENLAKLDVPTRLVVSAELLPGQQRTHDAVSALKDALA